MISCLIASLILLIALVISWGLTCGIVYLITLCFGLAFDWLVVTGIWLVLVLLTSCFGRSSK